MANTTPGYVFTSATDPITYSKLNLLGSPTVTVGTNEIITAMIANNSVTTAKLAQATGGGFIGRTTATLGDVSFVTLNDGSVGWNNNGDTLAIGKSTGQLFFKLGNSDNAKLMFQYGSSATPPNEIFVGSSTTTVEQFSNGATRWTGGTLEYYIGNGSSSRSLALSVSTAGIAGSGFLASSATIGSGYATGAGGTVTQATNRTTSVTLNTVCGAITTNNTSLAALASATFSVLNSTVVATDTVVVSIKSGAVNEKTIVKVSNVNAGNFTITVYNADAVTAETGAIVINFAVIKAVAS